MRGAYHAAANRASLPAGAKLSANGGIISLLSNEKTLHRATRSIQRLFRGQDSSAPQRTASRKRNQTGN
jgi:hypothetical protein